MKVWKNHLAVCVLIIAVLLQNTAAVMAAENSGTDPTGDPTVQSEEEVQMPEEENENDEAAEEQDPSDAEEEDLDLPEEDSAESAVEEAADGSDTAAEAETDESPMEAEETDEAVPVEASPETASTDMTAAEEIAEDSIEPLLAATTISVKDAAYGAKGDGTTDDTRAIQKALNVARGASADKPLTVTVPAGTYKISTSLWIYSYTNLELASGATIQRSGTSVMLINGEKGTGGYDQLIDVTIQGGTWDGNINSSSASQVSDLIYLWHGRNITIRDTTLKECVGTHHIELTGIKDSTISNVTFQDMVRYSGISYPALDGDGTGNTAPGSDEATDISEALQLDYASSATSGAAAPLDGTICKNITISGCTFTNCFSGVGSHHAKDGGAAADITVTGCTFDNIGYACVFSRSFKNLQINNCTANNVSEFLYAANSTDAAVKNCTITCTGASRKTANSLLNTFNILGSKLTMTDCTVNGIDRDLLNLNDGSTGVLTNNTVTWSKPCIATTVFVSSGSNLTMTGNKLTNNGSGKDFNTVQCQESSTLTAKNNTITNAEMAAFRVKSGATATLTNNTITGSGTNGISAEGAAMNISGGSIKNTTKSAVVFQSGSSGSLSNVNIQTAGSNGVTLFKGGSAAVGKVSITKCRIYGSVSSGIFANSGTLTIQGNVIKPKNYDTTWGIQLDAGPTGTVTRNAVGGKGITNDSKASVNSNAAGKLAGKFMVIYYSSESANPSGICSLITYGTSTALKTVSQLYMSKSGYVFAGWKAYRDDKDMWYADSSSGSAWVKLTNGKLPSGYTYHLYGNGAKVAKTAPAGSIVSMYAVWEKQQFVIHYHKTESDSAASVTTTVPYGTNTATRSTSSLGFAGSGNTFKGWMVYREIDKKWYYTNGSANGWYAKNSQPAGYYFKLYTDGCSVAKTAQYGKVHFYGRWNPDTFTIKYHKTDSDGASSVTTKVSYGTSTATKTASALGFSRTGYSFKGWTVYREYDKKWCYTNGSANGWYIKGKQPSGYTLKLYTNGCTVAKTAAYGNVHLYGQWKKK